VRRAGRTDDNQKDIVDALRKAGASVFVTSGLGDGFPDLVVGFRGRTSLHEIKGEKAELSEEEAKFFATWRGEVHIVRSPKDALGAIGAIK
jgi:hypothetical protein